MIRRALFVLLLAWGTAGAAEPPPPATPEGALSFAEVLLSAGESFRAVTEYQRFLHHFPTHPEQDRAWKGMGVAYAQAGRWEEAAACFGRLPPEDDSRRLLGAALYQGQRYGDAAGLLLANPEGEAEATLGTLAVLREGLTELPAGARQDLIDEFQGLPRKRPATAGTLAAVVPGAGHLYCGRPRDAAVAFVLNAAFIWGTYEAARREEWALAGVLGAFELGWYSGNVVSAVNAAHKWNRREEGQFFRKWEAAALPAWRLSLAPGAAGLSLAWAW